MAPSLYKLSAATWWLTEARQGLCCWAVSASLGSPVGHFRASSLCFCHTSVEKRKLWRLLSGIGILSSWRKYRRTCTFGETNGQNEIHTSFLDFSHVNGDRDQVFTWAMTSRDQLSFIEMGWELVGVLLSFSDGRSKVGPKTVARLCKDILLTLSFSATL